MRFFIYFLLQACLAIRPEDYAYALFLQAMANQDEDAQFLEDDEDEDDQDGWAQPLEGFVQALQAPKVSSSKVKRAIKLIKKKKAKPSSSKIARAIKHIKKVKAKASFAQMEDDEDDDFEYYPHSIAPMMVGGRNLWSFGGAAKWLGNQAKKVINNKAVRSTVWNAAKQYGPKLASAAASALLR